MDNLVKPDDNVAISKPHNISEENNRLQALVGTLRRTVERMIDIESEIAEQDELAEKEETEKLSTYPDSTLPTKDKLDGFNGSLEQSMDTAEELDKGQEMTNSGAVDTSDFIHEGRDKSADVIPNPVEGETDVDIFLKNLLGEMDEHEVQLSENHLENDVQKAVTAEDCDKAEEGSVEFPVFDLSELITEAPEQCFNFSCFESENPTLELDFSNIINESSAKSLSTTKDGGKSLLSETEINSERTTPATNDIIESETTDFYAMDVDIENHDPFKLLDFEDDIFETTENSAELDKTKLCDNIKQNCHSAEVTTEIPCAGNSNCENPKKYKEANDVSDAKATRKKLKYKEKLTLPKDYKVKFSDKMARFLGIDLEEPGEKTVEKEVEEVPESSSGTEPEVSGHIRGRRQCTLKKKTCYEGYEKKTPTHDPELIKFGKHLMASYHAILTDYQTEMDSFVAPPTPEESPELIDMADDDKLPSPKTLRDLHMEYLKKINAEKNQPICIDLTDDNMPCSSKSVSAGQKKPNDDVTINLEEERNVAGSSKGLTAGQKSSVAVDINAPGTSKASRVVPDSSVDKLLSDLHCSGEFVKPRETRKRTRRGRNAAQSPIVNEFKEKDSESTAHPERTTKQHVEDKKEDKEKPAFDRAKLAALLEEKFNRVGLSEGTAAFMREAPKMEGCLLPFTSRLLGTVWGNRKPTSTDPSFVAAKRNCELQRVDKERMGEKANEMRMKYGDDVTIFIDENKDMITTVELYHPVEKGYLAADLKRTRGKPKLAMVLDVLSSNTLEELCNNFLCSNDYVSCEEISHPDKFSQHILLNRDAAFEKLPTATLLIDNTIYSFKDENKGYDTANLIDDWVKSNVPKGVGPFEYGDLASTLVGDQTIRFGYPYVYIHLGSCEHTVIFKKSRLINADDNTIGNSYPMIQSIEYPKIFCKTHKKNDKLKNIKNRSTAQYMAKFAVVDSDRLPDNPTLLCQTCVEEFCYDKKKKKIGSFKLYPFLQVHAAVKDKY